MKEIWNAYVEMIVNIAKAIDAMVYYLSAKIYFAEKKHLAKVLAK